MKPVYLLKFSLIVILLVLGYSVFSQSLRYTLIPFNLNGKWGYMNREKEIIVQPYFDEADFLFSNRARVKLNGKYGFLDENGNMVIKLKYDWADNFKSGTCKVVHRDKSFWINDKGKRAGLILIPSGGCIDLSMYPLDNKVLNIYKDNGLYGIKFKRREENHGKFTVIQDSTEAIFDSIIGLHYNIYILEKGNKYDIIWYNSVYTNPEKIFEKTDFKIDEFKFFEKSPGHSSAIFPIIGFRIDHKWGYVDVHRYSEFKIVEAKYFSISPFDKEFALVEYEEGKFGYIDRVGNEYWVY